MSGNTPHTISPGPLVLKKSNQLQPFNPQKFAFSLRSLSWGLDLNAIDIPRTVREVYTQVTTQITSRDLRRLAATYLASRGAQHPDIALLAGRLVVAGMHKSTLKSFSQWVNVHATGTDKPIACEVVDAVNRFGDELDSAVNHAHDFDLTYFQIHTLLSGYLLRRDGVVVERPQYMWLRVSIALHPGNIRGILTSYDALSRGLYIHGSPVLYRGGTARTGFASCFLYEPDAMSCESTVAGVCDVGDFWNHDGGVGIGLSTVPARSPGTRGRPGVMPLLGMYDALGDYVSLCGRSRPCAAAAYVPIWHKDVEDVIPARCNRAPSQFKLRRIFPAVWVPDVFMSRLAADGTWSLFDPPDVPDLLCTHGRAFTVAYEQYESAGIPMVQIPAARIWSAILDAQMESGTPFIMFSDSVNAKNNESHLGTITTSNLCTEIVQYADDGRVALCNVASIALPRFVIGRDRFDFDSLHRVTKLAVANADALIDLREYASTGSAEHAARTRALGVGVQGLADVFLALRMEYDGDAARALNREIFETVYHAALEQSAELAELHGPYTDYRDSPASAGILQIDMWGVSPSNRHDFPALRSRIREFGLRNSMLTAQMPTASTACILLNSQGTDPLSSAMPVYKTGAGDYLTVSRWLVRDLEELGLWNEAVRSAILRAHGSVQDIPNVPDDVKRVHRTVWEIDPMSVVEMAADRAPFIDQSQSMSLHVTAPTHDILTTLLTRAWGLGLKTGLYYLRTRARVYPMSYGDRAGSRQLQPPRSVAVEGSGHSPESPMIAEGEQSTGTPGDGRADEAVPRPACESCSG